MVVLTQGIADKNQYRKFKVKNPQTFSDFAMLEEVIKRRFKNSWPQPKLIVVDGGKPQVRTVLKTLAEINKNIAVVGLAKNPDRLIIGHKNLPTIRPNIHRSGFNLLRFIRDESHRFAHKYHLYLRNKKLYNKGKI
jgi:excinuclease ABC subunit C